MDAQAFEEEEEDLKEASSSWSWSVVGAAVAA